MSLCACRAPPYDIVDNIGYRISIPINQKANRSTGIRFIDVWYMEAFVDYLLKKHADARGWTAKHVRYDVSKFRYVYISEKSLFRYIEKLIYFDIPKNWHFDVSKLSIRYPALVPTRHTVGCTSETTPRPAARSVRVADAANRRVIRFHPSDRWSVWSVWSIPTSWCRYFTADTFLTCMVY